MTQRSTLVLGSDTQLGDPGERLGAYLRRRYPLHGPKRLARDVGCTPKAAENLLNGHWPRAWLFGNVVRRFGQDVIDALFGSDIDRARLEREVRSLEAQLERKRAGLEPVGGSAARGQGRVAAPERRAFG